MNKVRFLTICLFTSGLFACSNTNCIDQNCDKRDPLQYTFNYRNIQFYPHSYDDMTSAPTFAEPKENRVPENYYAGPHHSPASHKDVDRNWVNGQNPRGYTIELGESEKASQVAGKLYQAPKKDRMAEIKSYRNGNIYYKGVYGSYNTYEDAQKALNSLPPDIKQGANIKSWSSVQGNDN